MVYDAIGNVSGAPKGRFQFAQPQAAALLVFKHRSHLRIINRNDRASPVTGVRILTVVVGGFGVRPICPESFAAE